MTGGKESCCWWWWWYVRTRRTGGSAGSEVVEGMTEGGGDDKDLSVYARKVKQGHKRYTTSTVTPLISHSSIAYFWTLKSDTKIWRKL